jgi:hypothetical protein
LSIRAIWPAHCNLLNSIYFILSQTNYMHTRIDECNVCTMYV